MNRAGVVRYDGEILAQMLGFPPGHRVLHAVRSNQDAAWDDAILLLVVGPTMPEIGECQPAPEVRVAVVQVESRRIESEVTPNGSL